MSHKAAFPTFHPCPSLPLSDLQHPDTKIIISIISSISHLHHFHLPCALVVPLDQFFLWLVITSRFWDCKRDLGVAVKLEFWWHRLAIFGGKLNLSLELVPFFSSFSWWSKSLHIRDNFLSIHGLVTFIFFYLVIFYFLLFIYFFHLFYQLIVLYAFLLSTLIFSQNKVRKPLNKRW